jgi:hypothetical protein
MKIAIAAYVDNHDKEKFADECNIMTFSGQKLDERFTFLIYAHPDVVPMIDIYDNVKIIPYTVPDDRYYSDYRFAKSLVFVYDDPSFLEGYDYVCKTDTDVIFTDKLNSFNFEENKIYTGLGYYIHNEKMIEDMYSIAKKFGYPNYKRIADMHSTIICSTKNIIKIMKLSDNLCREMYYGLDNDGEWGKSIWRGYIGGTSGVCSMYAAEIVIASLYKEEDIIVTRYIDGGSSWEEEHTKFYHYHCYHHDNIYSKFQAKYGSYLDIKEQSGNSSATYCMNIYVKRRDLGKINPHIFNKPEFTIYPLPPGFNGNHQIKYEFRKMVD